jgi:hypothetical protein
MRFYGVLEFTAIFAPNSLTVYYFVHPKLLIQKPISQKTAQLCSPLSSPRDNSMRVGNILPLPSQGVKTTYDLLIIHLHAFHKKLPLREPSPGNGIPCASVGHVPDSLVQAHQRIRADARGNW